MVEKLSGLVEIGPDEVIEYGTVLIPVEVPFGFLEGINLASGVPALRWNGFEFHILMDLGLYEADRRNGETDVARLLTCWEVTKGSLVDLALVSKPNEYDED